MTNPFAPIRFGLSAVRLVQLPPDTGAEVAFFGRSNAGKSSAINAITGRKALARTSKTPGRTTAINVFFIDDRRRLVDLPGFGYARVSQTSQRQWQGLLARYLQTRVSLRGLVLVVDIRRGLTAYDTELLTWCHNSRVLAHVLLSKCDKLNRADRTVARKQVEQALGGFTPRVSLQLFSALKCVGVAEARRMLAHWLAIPANKQKKAPANKGREPGA
ncbi:MAG: ribosome biogenesis GTP-binding protein YihA/YsxC [Acidiferrobacterales bacterium]|nr:ribosome biogenesis GTP-binding protein YihA/YsxC [Acidiferrobacterales bacterium]